MLHYSYLFFLESLFGKDKDTGKPAIDKRQNLILSEISKRLCEGAIVVASKHLRIRGFCPRNKDRLYWMPIQGRDFNFLDRILFNYVLPNGAFFPDKLYIFYDDAVKGFDLSESDMQKKMFYSTPYVQLQH